MKSPYYKLSRNEIDTIKDDVKKSEITFSHLEEELIDHLCCMVEDLVNDGCSFEKAFDIVKKDVGLNSLKSIEVQTIILINKKFNAMKKTLKISGIIGLSAISISFFMKIMHLPGYGLLVMLGFGSLLFAYLPALWLTLKKEKIQKRKINLSYIGIFAAFTLLLSVLFTIQHWPFDDLIRYISWSLMLIFLIMLFSNVMKSEENRVLNLSMLLFFAILFVINLTFNFLDINNPRVSKLTIENNIDESIMFYNHKSDKIYQQLSLSKNNPQNNIIIELKTKTLNITNEIEQARDAIFANKEEQENFNKKLIKSFAINRENWSYIKKLISDIESYQKFLTELAKSQPELKLFIEKSIVFGEIEYFNNPPVIYNNLQKLIRDIKIAESELLSEMQQPVL